MDFQEIHETIKSFIEGDGFKYVSADEWPDFESGFFPESFKNDGFTVRILEQSEGESSNYGKVRLEIIFALDPINDLYLARIGKAQTAIREMSGILRSAGITVLEHFQNWHFFSLSYFPVSIFLTFGNIEFQIESN